MKKIIKTLILSLLLGLNPILHAQSQRGTLGFGLMIGGARLSGDIEKSHIGLAGGLMLRLSPQPFFAFTAQTSYGQMTTGLNALKTDVLNVGLTGTLFLLPSKKFNPFLSLGYTSFHFVARDGDKKQLFRPDGSPMAGWVGAVQTGFGFEFFVADAWALNASIDYFFSHSDELDGISQGKKDGYFNGLIGFVHYFKKRTKLEEDENFTRTWQSTIENAEVEEQPSNEEESLELEPRSLSETISTLISDDPEDIEVEKEYPATLPPQQSPRNVPEQQVNLNENRKVDSNVSQNEETEPSGISFEPGSAKILEKSIPLLKQIYRYLIKNPEAEIEVPVFIGDNKDKESDKMLAIERAKAVKTYLVNLGIKPERILIIAK